MKRPEKGFTLIELMIVVVILGVLASIAIASYRRYIIKARTSEAQGFVTQIKMAQDAYMTNFGQYAFVSDNCNTWDPNTCDDNAVCGTIPGKDRLKWTGVDADWVFLNFAPTTPLYFQVQTVAGAPNQACNGCTAYTVDFCNEVNTTDHWYIVRARGNGDEDGFQSFFGTTNNYNGLIILRPDE